MSFFKRHGAFETEDGYIAAYLPKRINTRRNRRRCLAHFWNRWWDCELIPRIDSHLLSVREENRLRMVAHCQDYLDQGGTLKRYSAWSGVKLRELNRRLADYRRQRLPGQLTIAQGSRL